MKVPSLVDGAGAIGVAIEQEAEVVAAVTTRPSASSTCGPDGLRIEAAEPRVALAVDLVDDDAAAPQEAPDPARPRAEERVDEDAHGLGTQPVEVERAPHVGLVARERVEALDAAGRLGVVERPARRRLARRARAMTCSTVGQDVGVGGRARGRLDLEAVVRPGVVATR